MNKITGAMKKFAMKEGKNFAKAEGLNQLRKVGTDIINDK